MTLATMQFPRVLRLLAIPAALATALLFAAAASAGKQYVENGHALSGYDAVAYFSENGPVTGDPAFVHEWNGATWLFALAENRDRFAAAPEAYAPQYDGHCGYAASNGYVVPGNPDFWRIVDGKLYLNLNKAAQERWLKDIPGHIAKADANWPSLNPS